MVFDRILIFAFFLNLFPCDDTFPKLGSLPCELKLFVFYNSRIWGPVPILASKINLSSPPPRSLGCCLFCQYLTMNRCHDYRMLFFLCYFYAFGALVAGICFGIVIPSAWLSIYILIYKRNPSVTSRGNYEGLDGV